MHIPDGFLDHKTAGGLGLAAAAIMGYALNKVHQLVTSPAMATAMASVGKSMRTISSKARQALSAHGQEYLAKIGMVTSLIFVAQMLDFPVSNGTSGHFLGGVLAAVLLGPWGGSVAMSIVLITQAVFCADGGIAALGANIINMAVLGCVVPYYIYRLLLKRKILPQIAVASAAWLSVILAAAACATELAASGIYSFRGTFLAMVKVHLILGVCEALITLGLLLIFQKIMKWAQPS